MDIKEDILLRIAVGLDKISENVKPSEDSSLTPITYADLKSLRDSGKLVPGQQYRITDYHCTTTQADTMSADHQFDIIVIADDEKTLNENARAIQHEFGIILDAYSYSWIDMMRYVKDMEYSGETYFLYESDLQDLQMLVRYDKLLLSSVKEEREYPYEFRPIWTRAKDGDSWGDWESGYDYGEAISFKIDPRPYFKDSNLAAWELKYCLDNDTDRFAWASAVEVSSLDIGDGELYLYKGYFDGFHTWEQQPDGAQIFTTSRNPSVGDPCTDEGGGEHTIIAVNATFTGKGVIYYMKDEWNNECPYDFKNIMFVRKLTDGVYDPYSGTDTWVYTFTGMDEINNYEVGDWSILSAKIVNDEGVHVYCYGNIIRESYSGGESGYDFALNDIVFLSRYIDMNTAPNCNFNTFGDDCHHNTFGDDCGYNTLVDGCGYITFGDDCSYNTLGDGCGYKHLEVTSNKTSGITGDTPEFWFNGEKKW